MSLYNSVQMSHSMLNVVIVFILGYKYSQYFNIESGRMIIYREFQRINSTLLSRLSTVFQASRVGRASRAACTRGTHGKPSRQATTASHHGKPVRQGSAGSQFSRLVGQGARQVTTRQGSCLYSAWPDWAKFCHLGYLYLFLKYWLCFNL